MTARAQKKEKAEEKKNSTVLKLLIPSMPETEIDFEQECQCLFPRISLKPEGVKGRSFPCVRCTTICILSAPFR